MWILPNTEVLVKERQTQRASYADKIKKMSLAKNTKHDLSVACTLIQFQRINL